jgi:hypothetical protein
MVIALMDGSSRRDASGVEVVDPPSIPDRRGLAVDLAHHDIDLTVFAVFIRVYSR